jgi:hypothetical protein
MAYETAQPAKPAQSARIGAKLTPRIANVVGAELWRDSPDYASDSAWITYPLRKLAMPAKLCSSAEDQCML